MRIGWTAFTIEQPSPASAFWASFGWCFRCTSFPLAQLPIALLPFHLRRSWTGLLLFLLTRKSIMFPKIKLLPSGDYWVCISEVQADITQLSLGFDVLARISPPEPSHPELLIGHYGRRRTISEPLADRTEADVRSWLQARCLSWRGFEEDSRWRRDGLTGRHAFARCEHVTTDQGIEERWLLILPEEIPSVLLRDLAERMRRLQAWRRKEAGGVMCVFGCAGWRDREPICDGTCSDSVTRNLSLF
jgi:hypothetical protein